MTQSNAPVTRAKRITNLVRGRVASLQYPLLAGDHTQSAAQATLARLRRCQAGAVGANPEVWEITLSGIPDDLMGRSDAPSPAEMAIHAAMVLYAHHQQSQHEPMHVAGVGLGAAVRRLAVARAQGDNEFDSSVISKFHQVALAPEWEGRMHHLSGLISLLRGEAIALDYGVLAADLWRLTDDRQDQSIVLTKWGRGLHSRPKQETSGEDK